MRRMFNWLEGNMFIVLLLNNTSSNVTTIENKDINVKILGES